MKSYRRLWMVAVIAAFLGGCAGENEDGSRGALAIMNGVPDAPRVADHSAASPGGAFGNPTPSPSSMTPSTEPPRSAPMDASSGAAGAGAGANPVPPGEDTEEPARPNTQSGTLTAGAWDDNLNFDRFSEQRTELLQARAAGALPTTDKEHAAAQERWGADRAPNSLLDIALVIDTTGSMGDEITYLQTELTAISQSIEARYPDAEQRWSLIVYRDDTDEYVTRVFAFTGDIAELRGHLLKQNANGGGDFPEAPDAALAAMNDLEWRTEGGIARLAFWVADAPHHADDAELMADAIRGSSELDVHIYPVASSGIDDLTELTMRSAAQLTGGRYLFLTDDSGVGGEHKEPNLPCYFVTRLDQAMLRMVDIEMTGEYREPEENQIIRTGGDPEDGACTLASGEEVEVF